MEGGMKNWRFSTYVALCFENGKRCGCYSYGGRRIGTRMLSIERYHFQWPWVALDQDFKVTIFWTSNNSRMVQDKVL